MYNKIKNYLLPEHEETYCTTECGKTNHILILGGGLLGERLIHFLKKDEEIALIDNNPEVITKFKDKGIELVYGDAKEKSTLDRANAKYAKIIISTIKNEDINKIVFNNLKNINKRATKILSATSIESALELYEKGADLVIYPDFLAAKEASDKVQKIYDNKKFEEIRENQINLLKKELDQKK